ncbi:SET domain - like 10 [Theobroma cacao]|nr:SET domain - like 10 [Theobroma cacao]
MAFLEKGGGGDEEDADTPIRYVSLDRVYSAASLCVSATNSSNVMSKKVKARKLIIDNHHHHHLKPHNPPLLHVYARRPKRPRQCVSFYDSLLEDESETVVKSEVDESVRKKRRVGKSELAKLGVDSSVLSELDRPRLRDSRNNNSVNNNVNNNSVKKRRHNSTPSSQRAVTGSATARKWVRLSFDGVHPKAFVFWPLDADWYSGRVVGYNAETNRHHVEYEDGDEEDLILSIEKLKFHVSHEEMECLNLSFSVNSTDDDGYDYDEMVALAASLDDCQELEPGDIIWAKLTDESLVGDRKGLSKVSGGRSVPVQFFGTHDFARIKIKQDSEYFQGDGIIWPEGYTAVRKFTSLIDPSVCTLYRMEVLRDPQSKSHPLFRVANDGEKFEGPDPSACWNKIYKRIRKRQNDSSYDSKVGIKRVFESGSDMFGFSNPEVIKLIQGLSKSRLSSKFSAFKLASGRYRDLPAGYRPVRVDWKDLDKCSVCHMDEEYENNLFLQCDKCRMMVHARCYGELEPVDGVLWLCNLCRPGAPQSPPACCLCPVIGGAMKPTTDGRWAHLACAIWIPETCLSDVKRMEPIDGLNRINKDRWKLLCSICGVSYGACIQCSNTTCRVAYHPLCARAAGLCVELEDEDRLFLLSVDEDDEDQCIRLLSFCKKHRQPSNDRLTSDERVGRTVRQCSEYTPPLNLSGCARTEPYNHFGRRGRKEPEALAAASLKRLFVENQPYLVGGCCQHGLSSSTLPNNGVNGVKFSFSLNKLKAPQLDAPNNILSVAEKYNYMRQTFRKRLAFGKSGIHGFGIFAKHPHRAGDMVIEYTGELVRPSIADRREHFIYNSLVPNCYSRVISIHGDDHIIIFAKRDIKRWEELTYDYRFFSIDEHLACYCGFPRCRGVVNDTEAEEQVSKIFVHRNELLDWTGE